MSPRRLSDLVEQLDLPPTVVAESAWPRARRRVRRRRAARGLAAVAAGVVLAVALPLLGDGGSGPPPEPEPATTGPSPSEAEDVVGTVGLTPEVTQPALSGERLDAVVRDAGELRLDPRGEPVEGNPVDIGRYAIGDEAGSVTVIAVVDGATRGVSLGVEPLRGDPATPLRPGSMSPDAARLALPQPGSVVVADLLAGTVTRWSVGDAGNDEVAWRDADHVLVQGDEAALLDVRDGSIVQSELTAPLAFTDAGPVTWGADGVVRLPSGTVTPMFGNDGGLGPTAPLAGDGVVVGLTTADDGATGPVVLDLATGDPLAFLPTGEGRDTTTLLRIDGETVTLALRPSESEVVVVEWRWRTGELEPLLRTADGATGVSWSADWLGGSVG